MQMLASSSNNSHIFSFHPYMNQTLPQKSINNDHETPNFRFEQLCSPASLQFSDLRHSPFLDDDQYLIFNNNFLFSQQQQQLLGTFNSTPPDQADQVNKLIQCDNNDEQPSKEISKKQMRSSKSMDMKNNSKIYTSKGPRERRMRLSLEIARSFFELQDMLGFDKASTTVEWLFAKSINAIKELQEKYVEQLKCNCSDDDDHTKKLDKNFQYFFPFPLPGFEFEDGIPIAIHREKEKKKKKKILRIVDKESRYKARARARERTRQKLIHRLEKSKQDFEANPPALELDSSAISPSREESCFQIQEMKSSFADLKVLELDEVDHVFDLLYAE